MGSTRSGIRYREDVGLEARCEQCNARGATASYWPLTREFWDFNAGFRRCRACHLVNRRVRETARYRADQDFRAAKLAIIRRWRAESVDAIRTKRQVRAPVDAEQSKARYWADPEAARAKSRASYYRRRDAVLAKRRADYAAKKAA